MNKKLLALGAVAALLCVLNLASRAQSGAERASPQAPFQSLVSPATCAQPQWPKEAIRYEIEGMTTIRFEIGADGQVLRPTVAKGSGWKILDDAALRGIAQCRFKPNLDEAKDGTAFPLQYVWKLSGDPAFHPLLVADSCAPSGRFATFKDLDRRPSSGDGILVRFIVGAGGVPARAVPEPNGQPAELVAQALAYLQTCRFAIDPAVTGERTDTAFGRVVLKPASN